MRSSRVGEIPSEIGWLIDELDDFSQRLRTLEAPSGESLNSTVPKLTALVANIQAQLDSWVAGRWTNAQITTEISSGITSRLAGNVNVGGSLSALDAVSFLVTGARRTAWLEDATGRLGNTASNRDLKTSIRPADNVRLGRLLDIEPKSFIYRAELQRRTQLRIDSGVDYTPARESGLIAQDLEEAGLSDFVIHGRNGEVQSIEYGMLTVALLSIARDQRDQIRASELRLAALERKLG